MKKKILVFVSVKVVIIGIVVLSVLYFMPGARAVPIETFQFESAETERVFHKLSEELRCLVCQNQNIAESNADLAKDLRLEIYTMLSEGKSEEEIIDFMVQRYGDYVLYRPPVKPLTWLLWFGPFIIFALGVAFVVYYLRGQSKIKQQQTLSPEDLERIRNLHAEQKGKNQ